jgi:hypothetical protein
MAIPQIPLRERQALEEVGVTAIPRGIAWMATVGFLITIGSVPLVEPVVERSKDSWAAAERATQPEASSIWQDFGREVAAGLDRIEPEGILVANRALLAAFHNFEERLEEDFLLRQWLLPRLQWRLAATLGLGNEKVYVGRAGWLFFRPDLDHVTGPGFLQRRALAKRRRGGEVWMDAPEPDPLPALMDLHRQLADRGIQLVVVPTPVKPTIEPEWLASRARGVDSPLQNSSYAEFVRQLALAGIHVVDLAPRFVEVQRAGDNDRYLRADTHWTPTGVDQAARVLAEAIEAAAGLEGPDSGLYRRRGVVVEGMGDIAQMLVLSAGQTWLKPQRVEAQMVSDRAGKRWRAKRDSEILLLGDSFSNVYSDPTLGWGGGAGLAEQLSFHLQRPLDKLAVNAGGALQARMQLQRALSAGDDRLKGKKVLVYQFATRELSQGDWQLLQLGQ